MKRSAFGHYALSASVAIAMLAGLRRIAAADRRAGSDAANEAE